MNRLQSLMKRRQRCLSRFFVGFFAIQTARFFAGCLHAPEAPLLEPQEDQHRPKGHTSGSIRVLQVGQFEAYEAFVHPKGQWKKIILPIWVGLYEHPKEGLVLIDSGFPSRTGTAPEDYPGRFQTYTLGLNVSEGESIAERLHELDYSPADVKHIIITHMHSDHVGGVEDFPDAAIWVHPDELYAFDHATSLSGYLPAPLEHRSLKTFNPSLSAPYGPFEESYDLFDDGSIRIVSTPGHTAGHLSVLLQGKGFQTFFLGDVAWIDRHWKEPSRKSTLISVAEEFDWKMNLDALWRIHHFINTTPNLIVISGHEPSAMMNYAPWPAILSPHHLTP